MSTHLLTLFVPSECQRPHFNIRKTATVTVLVMVVIVNLPLYGSGAEGQGIFGTGKAYA